MIGPGFAAAAAAEMLRPLSILVGSLGILFVLGMGTLYYLAHNEDLVRKAYQQHCVDAGGVPVATYSYIKGSTDGRLCINPSAIIQLKDEK